MKFTSHIHIKKGFTLIEALVALGIFSVVIVAASGVILSIISSNKKNQAISSVVNNLNYSIESMVRDIKTGYKYQCDFGSVSTNVSEDIKVENYKLLPGSCGMNGRDTLSIMLVSTISGKEQIVKYELVNSGTDSFIQKTVYMVSGGNVTPVAYPLTDAKNITINSLMFTIRTPYPMIPQPDPNLGEVRGQPGVRLMIKGTAKVNQINISDFFIQTYISQRLPNFI